MEGQVDIDEFTSVKYPGLEAIPYQNAFKKPEEPGSQVGPVGNKTPQTFENTHQDETYLADCDNCYTVVYAKYVWSQLTFW